MDSGFRGLAPEDLKAASAVFGRTNRVVADAVTTLTTVAKADWSVIGTRGDRYRESLAPAIRRCEQAARDTAALTRRLLDDIREQIDASEQHETARGAGGSVLGHRSDGVMARGVELQLAQREDTRPRRAPARDRAERLRRFSAKMAEGRRMEAAWELTGMDAQTLAANLNSFSSMELAELRVAALANGDPTLDQIVEGVRKRAYDREFDLAVRDGNFATALDMATPYDNTELVARLRGLSDADLAGLGRAAVAQDGPLARVHRAVLFMQNDPGPQAPRTSYEVTPGGTGQDVHVAAVPGGTVAMRVGVHARVRGHPHDFSDGFEISYTGEGYDRVRFLQVLRDEMTVDSGTYQSPMHGHQDTGTGWLELSTPGRPVHHLDSPHDPPAPPGRTPAPPQTPFYNGVHRVEGPQARIAMYDRPSYFSTMMTRVDLDVINSAFISGAKKVTMTTTFDTYVVRDMDVLYRFEHRTSVDIAAHGYDLRRLRYGPDDRRVDLISAGPTHQTLPAHRDAIFRPHEEWDPRFDRDPVFPHEWRQYGPPWRPQSQRPPGAPRFPGFQYLP